MSEPLRPLVVEEPEHWAAVYARQRPKDWSSLWWVDGYYPFRRFDRLLRAYIAGRDYRTFLDLGCGTGRWLVYAGARLGLRPIGLDYSREAVDLSRRALEVAGIPGEVHVGDATAVPTIPPADVVYLGGVIEHYENPAEFVARAARWVAPGGTLVNWVPTKLGINGFWWRWLGGARDRGFRSISAPELELWNAECGLGRIEVTYSGSLCLSMFPKETILPEPRWLHLALIHAPIRLADACISSVLIGADAVGLRIEHPVFSPYCIAFATRAPKGP